LCTGQEIHSPARATQIASAVPSPPSASGQTSTCAAGSACRIPAAIASPTARAPNDPLNLSGTIKIRMAICFLAELALPREKQIDLATAILPEL
jgi:hypothetical protein